MGKRFDTESVGGSAPAAGQSSGTLSKPGLRPCAASKMVPRNDLVARLEVSSAPLVVLSAPAGSGKTTLLLQWAQGDSRPYAWLQLEDAHNAPVVLADDLATVLAEVTSVDPSIHRWTHLSSPPLRERILPSLRVSVAQAPPFLLVLDDSHVVTGTDSWKIVETLLDALPTEAQLAIGTRAEPPLTLAKMEAAGALMRLGGGDLAFTLGETANLFDLHGIKTDEQTSAALHIAMEGWAAGLSLALLACGGECTSEWLATLDGRHGRIARYLTTEVLDRQGPEMRGFLLDTSILARLSDASCRAVTGRTDSGEVLAQLSRDNLFINPLDDKGEWYRYHHLFAELLQAELARRDGGRVSELHRLAAAWCEENGDLEEAVRHWLAAGEVKRAGDVVCLGNLLYLGQGQGATVSRWIRLFTTEQMLAHVPLSLVAALVAAMTRDSVPQWIAMGLSVPADDTLMPYADGTTRAWQTMLRALVAPGGASAMLRDAELAVELGSGCHPAWTAAANVYLGAARWLAGDASGAEQAFRRSVQGGYEFNVIAQLEALGYLSMLMADQGRWDEAASEALRATQWFEAAELGSEAPVVTVAIAEARVHAHDGKLVPRSTFSDLERDLAEFQLPVWINLIVTINTAQAALDMADLALAEKWTVRSESIIRAWPDAGVMRARVEGLRGALLERQGAEPLTPAEGNVIELLATHLSLPEIAQRLVVSRNTLKTHVRDIYRKLGAHSRTAAVERARSLGLLRD